MRTITQSGIRGGFGPDELTGGAGNDDIRSSFGNDTVFGRGGDDLLAGQGGNDRLFGGAGNDRLFGGSGSDVLDGGTGNDLLVGGSGNNTLTGGQGNDVFVFSRSTGNDTITDYEVGADIVAIQVAAGREISRSDIEAVTVQVGDDLVVNLGNNQSITIEDATFDDVTFATFA